MIWKLAKIEDTLDIFGMSNMFFANHQQHENISECKSTFAIHLHYSISEHFHKALESFYLWKLHVNKFFSL